MLKDMVKESRFLGQRGKERRGNRMERELPITPGGDIPKAGASVFR
jgi:hypothetical protein